MKRRILSIMTALALCLGLCPAWVFAAEGDEPPAGGEALVVDVGKLPAGTQRLGICNNKVALLSAENKTTDLYGNVIENGNPENGTPFSSLVLTGTGAVCIQFIGSNQVTLRDLNITDLARGTVLSASGEGTAELTLEGNVSLSTATSAAIGLIMGHSVKMTGSGSLTVQQTKDNVSVDLIGVGDNCSLDINITGDVTVDAKAGCALENRSGSSVNPVSISARNITLKDATGKTSFPGVTLAPSGTMNVNGHSLVAKVTAADGSAASYVTLEDAWEAAQAGSPATVTLLDNVTLPATEEGLSGLWVKVDQDITFEGGAFTLTGAPSGLVLAVNGGKLTVSSGTIAATAITEEGTDSSYPAVIASRGEFVMTGGTLKGAEGSSGIGLIIQGDTVKLSGGSFTGGDSAVKYAYDDGVPTDALLYFLLNHGTETEPHYAYCRDSKPFAPTGGALPGGTFTVGECRHPGVELKKNADGSHGMSCPYCGYGYKHDTAYTATASGGVITVAEGCEEDESCGYEAPLGSLTVGIPQLAYGELDKEISLDTSKLTNWEVLGLGVDGSGVVMAATIGPDCPPIVTTAIRKLTRDGLLTAGEHTLTVKIGISDGGKLQTASCELPFTVDPAELKPDYVVAKNREYEKGNRAVALDSAGKGEEIQVFFPADTTGTVSGENAGIYDKVTLAQNVKDSTGNYIIPAGTYPVRGQFGNETPSEDGVMIIQAQYKGLCEVNTSAKAGTTGTYDFTNLLQGIDGARLEEPSISGDNAIFDGEPTVSGNILTYKLKADAEVGGTGRIEVSMKSTNYVAEKLYVWVTVTDKDVPALAVSPITVTYNGEAVPASAIQGAAKVGNTTVPGTWAFAEGQTLTNVADSGAKAVKFTPTDGANYAAVEGTVMVTINKATPTGAPTYTAISASGKTLAEAGLTAPEGWPEGTLAWNLPVDTAVTANTQYEWTFTPTDTANYNTVTGKITLWAQSTGGGGGGGGGSSGGGSSSGSSGLPVTTTGQGSTATTTTTTAVPSATAQGGTATTTISTTMGQEIVKQAVANKSEEVVIAPKVTGSVTKAEVSIPASTVGQIGSQTEASLTVSTPVADVTIPNGGLGSLGSAGGTVTVTAEQTGNSVELTVTAGGKTVQNVPGGITLTVPATSTTPGTVAVLVRPDGTREVVRKSVADNGTVTVPLDGSAKLEIVDNSKYFADVPTMSWAADAVAFASAHELFGGTGTNQFSPDVPMSRGMLAVVLHNLESNPAQALTGAFSDVDNSQWYAEGVAWAEVQGIIGGYGNGRFGPNDNITREQLAVMLWRYAGSPAATDRELHFADAHRASDWALDALCWATENGIINGKGGGILDPTGQATRAETAQMLKNFMEKR